MLIFYIEENTKNIHKGNVMSGIQRKINKLRLIE